MFRKYSLFSRQCFLRLPRLGGGEWLSADAVGERLRRFVTVTLPQPDEQGARSRSAAIPRQGLLTRGQGCKRALLRFLGGRLSEGVLAIKGAVRDRPLVGSWFIPGYKVL